MHHRLPRRVVLGLLFSLVALLLPNWAAAQPTGVPEVGSDYPVLDIEGQETGVSGLLQEVQLATTDDPEALNYLLADLTFVPGASFTQPGATEELGAIESTLIQVDSGMLAVSELTMPVVVDVGNGDPILLNEEPVCETGICQLNEVQGATIVLGPGNSILIVQDGYTVQDVTPSGMASPEVMAPSESAFMQPAGAKARIAIAVSTSKYGGCVACPGS
jgi:hypothetical protein